MAVKDWKIATPQPKLAARFVLEGGLPPFVAEILANRGYSSVAQLQEFFGEDLQFEDPYQLADMQTAVERIRQALENTEKITVYGDYDCDGVTSTAVLYTYLSLLGADVSYYIPSREEEGYGLNRSAVKNLSQQGTQLMITVDNGISALEEVAYARQLGMDVIVTDHHQVGEHLPDALAVINPHRSDCPSTFKDLAGVGVAFKLVTALEDGDYSCTLEQFGDLVAIGTVGDVVPLIGENRSIVRRGLELLERTENLGLIALMEKAGLKKPHMTSQDIGFGISPRINAAGRMGDASLAVRLLLSDTEEEAQQLAEQLNHLNQLRKEQEEGIFQGIQQQIIRRPECLYDRVMTFYQQGWHPGIIGIVSSKILEQYGKPNLLMSLEDGILKGSARSVPGFSLYQALNSCSQHLIRYGGHTQAAGFTIAEQDFSDFKQELERYAAEHFRVMPSFTYQIDKELKPSELNLQNIRDLDILEPFGAENQQPLFCMRQAKLEGITPVSEDRHLRLKLNFGGVAVSAMYFGMSSGRFSYQLGDMLDLLLNISINHYNGREYLSAVIRDLRLSDFMPESFFHAKAYYEMFRRGEPISAAVLKKIIPSREDTALVYRHLRGHKGYSGDIEQMFHVFLKDGMNYCKYRLILDILSDVGLIEISPLLDGIRLCSKEGKVNLEDAITMKRLRQMKST